MLNAMKSIKRAYIPPKEVAQQSPSKNGQSPFQSMLLVNICHISNKIALFSIKKSFNFLLRLSLLLDCVANLTLELVY